MLHRKSKLPLLPLKHEVAEMCLVTLPEAAKNLSVTIMDGPFFSIMPFPHKKLHTLSHVRYTPKISWNDDEETPPSQYDTHRFLKRLDTESTFKKMLADVSRYIPMLADMTYVSSLHEIKTVLRKSEGDDSRPILFKPHYAMDGYTCIMGGKLDNIYDVFDELKEFYEKE